MSELSESEEKVLEAFVLHRVGRCQGIVQALAKEERAPAELGEQALLEFAEQFHGELVEAINSRLQGGTLALKVWTADEDGNVVERQVVDSRDEQS